MRGETAVTTADDGPDEGTEEYSDAASLIDIQIRRGRAPRPGLSGQKRGDITRTLAKRRLATVTAHDHHPETEESRLRDALHAVMPGPDAPPRAGTALMRPRLVEDPRRALRDQPRDIILFWAMLRQGRRYPTRSDMDPVRIAQFWPNTLLLRLHPTSQTLELESIISPHGRAGTDAVEFTPMVLEWVLELGRRVARIGEPVSETEPFPVPMGNVRYRAAALPLSEGGGDIDHILCHVSRA